MPFNYALSTDIGKVRLEIDDTSETNGVKPDGTNFSDEEIQVILTREGSVGSAAAGLCEILARAYARVATHSEGGRSESLSDISTKFTDQAKALRGLYGGGAGAFSATLQRKDAYHTYNEYDDSDVVEYDDRTVFIRV